MSTIRGLSVAEAPLDAVVDVPGSKSITLRAMACAAMAEGRSHLYGALTAEDSDAMAGALKAFGVNVDSRNQPWAIDGLGRHLRAPEQVVDAGESGLTTRMTMVLAAHADGGDTTIDGRGRMRERPIRGLVDALIAQGVAVKTTDGRLPVTIGGQSGLWGEAMEVDCSDTSQFATALLLGAPMASKPSTLKLTGLRGSAGYLEITVEVMEAFGARVAPNITGYDVDASGYVASDFLVEPDASAAVYPMVAAAITRGRVEIPGLSTGSKQPDIRVAEVLETMGCRVGEGEKGLFVDATGAALGGIDLDVSGFPDGALAVVVACLFAEDHSRLRGLFSLRHKESDRLEAIAAGVTGLGGRIEVGDEQLLIEPVPLHRGVVDPHGDHRIAMALALVGLRVPDVDVADPEVVNKTWPGYWTTLEAAAAN